MQELRHMRVRYREIDIKQEIKIGMEGEMNSRQTRKEIEREKEGDEKERERETIFMPKKCKK